MFGIIGRKKGSLNMTIIATSKRLAKELAAAQTLNTDATSKQLANELAAEQILNLDLKKQKSELEQTLTLLAARKVQSEHDKAEAIKQHTNIADDGTHVSIVRNNPSNLDIAECSMLAILNAKQVRKGLAPFKNYSVYLGDGTPPEITPDPLTLGKRSVVPTTKVDPVTPLDKLAELWLDYEGRPLRAEGDVYLIVNGGYYIGWNKSRCYIQKQDDNNLNVLVAGDRLYGDSSVMQIIPNKSFRDLTRAEVDNIIKGKPTYSDLFKVYSKFQNWQNVCIDITKAQAVW
jgi:hypothetical protein